MNAVELTFISQGCGCNVAISLIDRRRANKQRKLVLTPDSVTWEER